MLSSAIALGLGLSVFFLIVVPWLAFSGRREARVAREGLGALLIRVDGLRAEVEALRRETARQGSDTPEPALPLPVPQPDAAAVAKPAVPAQPLSPSVPSVAAAIPAAAAEAPPVPAVPAWADIPAPSGAAPWSSVAPPSAPVPSPAIPAPPPGRDFEELVGTRWAIWVGGLALALGSLFLVRSVIEAGFFGPLARLLLGAVFSAGLVAAGEMLRRGALLPRRLAAQLPAEHAPLALTAAGTVGLFGTVYAAYAVYGYLPQGAAFVLLGLIGIAAIAASAVHGQALAGLGLVGSYATPLLLGGESDSRWPLVVFLLAVTAAGLAVQARLRTRWLGWGLVAGVAAWTALLILGQKAFPVAELLFMLASIALFAGGFLQLRRPGYPLTPVGDPLPLVALMGLAAAMGLSFANHAGEPALHAAFALAAVALLAAAAVREGRAALAIVTAGLLPLGMLLTWPSESGAGAAHVRIVDGALLAIVSPPRARFLLGVFAALAAAIVSALPLALLRGMASARAPHAQGGLMALAITGGLAAPGLAFGWAVRSSGLMQNLPAALILAILCAALAGVTLALLRQAAASDTDGVLRAETGAGGYGAGAALAGGLAIAFALPGLWMAVGFATAALGTAVLNDRRALPMLRRVTAAFATTAILRAVTSPVLQNDDAWPVLNSYLIAYGLPVLLLAAAAWLLARRTFDRNVRVTLASAGLMGAVYGVYTIRHAFHRPELIDDFAFGLGESGLYVLCCLLTALGLHAVRRRAGASGAAGLRRAVAGVNSLGLLLLALLVLVVANPWLDGRISGWPVLDSTFVGFLLPGLALGVLAYLGRTQPEAFGARLTSTNRAFSIGLGYLFLLAQTRLAFTGQERFIRAYTVQAEHYAYSAVTLAFGVALLAIGFRLGSRPTRLASGVFVVLAVLKAFLIDMAALQGLLRALSFIGLGGVLIGIGLAYQRLLFDKRPAPAPSAPSRPPPPPPPSFPPQQPGGERVVP